MNRPHREAFMISSILRFTTISVVGLAAGVHTLSAQEPPEWRLAPAEFEVGGIEAGPDEEFANLGGVTLLDGGTVLVGDRVEPFLRVFGPDGELLRTLGRRGQGPGEYEYVYRIDSCSPGEISVYDVDSRVHRYGPNMTLISTELISFEALGGRTSYNEDCNPNGFEIVTGWGDYDTQFQEGLFEARAPVLLLRDGDVVYDFGERLSSHRVGSVRNGAPTGSAPHPFGRATVVALGSDRIYIGDAETYEIEVYDLAGQALPPVRWTGPPLDYDRGFVDELAEQAVSAAREQSRPALRRWYRDLEELEGLPAYDRILVSDQDELWVRQFVRPSSVGEEWVVFGPDQALIGRLRLPSRSTLWEVRGDRVVYAVVDEFDVPTVRVSRLVR